MRKRTRKSPVREWSLLIINALGITPTADSMCSL
jgi:hypothetical protein